MRPNILWICTDQQRWDSIAALGNPHIRTPNIDRLVREGTAFDHAFCQSPICTPSRASFLTGRYPSTVHGTCNGNTVWGEGAPLISTLLAEAGYDCGLVGKFHLAGGFKRLEPRPVNDGYRVFEWSHAPRDDWPVGHAWRDWVAAHGEDLGELCRNMTAFPVELHRETWCTTRAIDFIETERPAGQPWLLSINYYYPHPPFTPPREYLERYDPADMPGPLFRESDLAAQRALSAIDFQTDVRRPEEFDARRVQAAYHGMIEQLDDQLGRLLESLERSGQRENTLILFMSDHGEMMGDHGLLQKGCRFYEGLVRVPLIWAWPGRIEAGLRSSALTELTDIFPTLLELCGLEAPEGTQGRSLWPILTGAVDAQQHRDFVRCEYYRTLLDRGRGFEGSYATMYRDRRYKLVRYHGHDLGELFDLQEDPGEFDNLWHDPAYAAVRLDLLQRSFDALAFAVDTGPPQRFFS